ERESRRKEREKLREEGKLREDGKQIEEGKPRTIKPGVRKQDPECKVEQRNVTIPRDHHPVGSSSSSSDSSSDSD
uniref:Uncharacterized protein n=1 Tax=Ciona savignyi TaxID=51511 RepID=H2YBP7_CIOSA